MKQISINPVKEGNIHSSFYVSNSETDMLDSFKVVMMKTLAKYIGSVAILFIYGAGAIRR